METKEKNISSELSVGRMVEDIVGCKWSLVILSAVRKGILRPGAIQRSVENLSTKVLNERLSKMVRFGILIKQTFPESPPKVEYKLTRFGDRFIEILDQIEILQADISNDR